MKKFYSLALILSVISFSLNAQTFQVDTLLKNGPLQERINLVFMGDGYTASEQAKYITDVTEIIQTLFATPPFSHYKDYFNVFAIKVISLESGANHPKTSPDADCTFAEAVVNNYFGSTFDYANIHRLLYPNFPGLVATVLANNFPLYDQGFVVVNTPFYGGAGGAFATCSDHPNGREVAMHEIGHSFAGLADEYWAGPQYATEKPNMTAQSDALLIKWKNWLGTDNVGIYGHTGNAGWKKPHMNCKMGVLNQPLCPVCTETFVEKFHQHVKSLRSYSPPAGTMPLPTEALTFSLELIKPEPNTIQITWRKNNVIIASNVETLTLQPSEVLTPATLQVTVSDNTELQRSESHQVSHVYTVQWQLGTPEVITGIEPTEKHFKISAYPNPVIDRLNYSFTLEKPEKVKVDLLDTQGKEVRSLLNAQLSAGEHEYSVHLEHSLPEGEYILQYTLGGVVVTRKLVFAD